LSPCLRHRYACVLLEKSSARSLTACSRESVTECVPFRITRNADLSVREDLAGDLLSRDAPSLDARKRSGVCSKLAPSPDLLGFLRAAGVREGLYAFLTVDLPRPRCPRPG
jgi:hypothetical protein